MVMHEGALDFGSEALKRLRNQRLESLHQRADVERPWYGGKASGTRFDLPVAAAADISARARQRKVWMGLVLYFVPSNVVTVLTIEIR